MAHKKNEKKKGWEEKQERGFSKIKEDEENGNSSVDFCLFIKKNVNALIALLSATQVRHPTYCCVGHEQRR